MVEFFGFIAIAAVIVLVFFISGMYNERKEKQRYKEKLQREYGFLNKREYSPEGFTNLDGYYRHHKSEDSIDDITWNDLNMDDIFMQMNYSKTSAGDEYLYYLLRTPAVSNQDWMDFTVPILRNVCSYS